MTLAEEQLADFCRELSDKERRAIKQHIRFKLRTYLTRTVIRRLRARLKAMARADKCDSRAAIAELARRTGRGEI